MNVRTSSSRVEVIAAIFTLILVMLLTLLLLPAVVVQPASGQAGVSPAGAAGWALPAHAVQGVTGAPASAVF